MNEAVPILAGWDFQNGRTQRLGIQLHHPAIDDAMKKKVSGFLGMVFSDTDAYVYKLSKPLPRAYAARSVVRMPEDLTGKARIDFIQRHALGGVAVLSEEDERRLSVSISADAGPGNIEKTTLVRDGYDFQLNMPNGGLLVVNTVFSPFWKAAAKNRELTMVEANMIHLVIAVPAGTNRVELRYVRPMVKDRIRAFLDDS